MFISISLISFYWFVFIYFKDMLENILINKNRLFIIRKILDVQIKIDKSYFH